MRTRHQRQEAEAAGTVPSPPQSLPKQSRPKRARVQKSTATEGSNPPATQTTTSKASGRTDQRRKGRGGRGVVQSQIASQDEVVQSHISSQDDIAQLSDASTQASGTSTSLPAKPDRIESVLSRAAEHLSPESTQDAGNGVDPDGNGETPKFSLESAMPPSLSTPKPGLAQTELPGSSIAPLLTAPAVKILNLPTTRDNYWSTMQLLVDNIRPTCPLVKRPLPSNSTALELPTEQLAIVIKFIKAMNPELDFPKTHPILHQLVEEFALTAEMNVDVDVNYWKRDSANDDIPSSPVPPSRIAINLNPIRNPGHHLRQRAQAARNDVAEKWAKQQRRAAYKKGRNLSTPTRAGSEMRSVPQMYDDEGNLTLGVWKDMAVDVDERGIPISIAKSPNISQSAQRNSQEQYPAPPQIAAPPLTPATRGWGLSSLLPSAQTISKFIPFTSRQTPSANVAPTNVDPSPASELGVEHHDDYDSDTNTDTATPDQSLKHTPPSSALLRHRPMAPPVKYMTSMQVKEREKIKQKKQALRAEAEHLQAEKARIAQEKKEWEEQRAKAEGAQKPGTKRKRLPSPDVIPLPPGGGFGLHPDYFFLSDSSDEDETEDIQETPTKQRPGHKYFVTPPPSKRLKKLSFHATEEEVFDRYYGKGNYSLEGEGNKPEDENAQTSEEPVTTTSTTPTNHSGIFRVPSPSDSDSDSDEERDEWESDQQELLDRAEKLFPRTSPTSQRPATQAMEFAVWGTDDPVERARKKALQHQPKFGSKLKKSTRFSSSSVGSDVGNQAADVQVEDSAQTVNSELEDDAQYDPKRPGLHSAFTDPNPPDRNLEIVQDDTSGIDRSEADVNKANDATANTDQAQAETAAINITNEAGISTTEEATSGIDQPGTVHDNTSGVDQPEADMDKANDATVDTSQAQAEAEAFTTANKAEVTATESASATTNVDQPEVALDKGNDATSSTDRAQAEAEAFTTANKAEVTATESASATTNVDQPEVALDKGNDATSSTDRAQAEAEAYRSAKEAAITATEQVSATANVDQARAEANKIANEASTDPNASMYQAQNKANKIANKAGIAAAEKASITEQSALDPEAGIEWAYEAYEKTMTPKVRRALAEQDASMNSASKRSYEDIADREFDEDFAAWKKSRTSSKPRRSPSPSSVDRSMANRRRANKQQAIKPKATTGSLVDWVPSAYEQENLTPRVRAFLDNNPAPEITDEEFNEDFTEWLRVKSKDQAIANRFANTTPPPAFPQGFGRRQSPLGIPPGLLNDGFRNDGGSGWAPSAYEQENLNPRVRDFLDKHDAGEAEMTDQDFNEDFGAWLKEQENLDPSLRDFPDNNEMETSDMESGNDQEDQEMTEGDSELDASFGIWVAEHNRRMAM